MSPLELSPVILILSLGIFWQGSQPTLADCFLDGITRRTVIDLARRRGFEIVERRIKPEEMANASECFLTGTAVEVTPVGQIDKYSFTPGEVCNVLGEDYSQLVRGEESAVAAE